MIQGFADSETELIWSGRRSRKLPADIQSRLYNKDQIDPQQPTGVSAYRDFKPKKGPPWTIGYASSYAGNTWRAAALDKLESEINPKWKKLGLIKDVIVTQSNLKDSVQIQQMRQLVDRTRRCRWFGPTQTVPA